MLLCRSVGRSVRPSVGRSVGRSVRPSVRPKSLCAETTSHLGKIRILVAVIGADFRLQGRPRLALHPEGDPGRAARRAQSQTRQRPVPEGLRDRPPGGQQASYNHPNSRIRNFFLSDLKPAFRVAMGFGIGALEHFNRELTKPSFLTITARQSAWVGGGEAFLTVDGGHFDYFLVDYKIAFHKL